ncbi:hypothetical protein DFH07DRAFT_369310 [Mycena maculata]|uniref:Uncharacterized protein n=1 Tax=Mycena maculata TaxID=230809 RepID=A0AAD7MFW5_9AGAR|nr:hypothetical protein DFH07DRAFT_369310 [Mycena maculata]
MTLLPISLQVMIKGLYDTTVEFFALRNPTPAPGGQPSRSSHSESRTLTPVPDPIGKLTRECASLREQLDATDPDLRFEGSEPFHMRRGLENITNQLARSQAEVVKLEERCKMLERALRGTREMLEARESELEHLRKVASVSSLPEQVHDDSPGRQSSSDGSRNRLMTGNGTAGSTSMLVEEQRAQLRSTEIYMTRTDSWSGQQIIQAVQDLNSEIIQLAASAIELCTFDSKGPSTPQAMQDTSARLGPNLAGLLSARERNIQDPTLVGLALQAAMATCITRAMSSFALGLPSKSEVILSQIYSHMFVAEPQPTSARWRALTHRHVHTLYPGLTDYAAEELRETICRWTSDILVSAAATHESTSRGWIRETFGEQIGRMVKSVAGIATICREEILSTNFSLFIVEPGQIFDERMMQDAFGDYGASQGAVLATTELGLRRMTRKSVAGREDDRTVEQQLLVRPKVILDSVGTAFG